ncbi:DHA2 family efflux MFS transporter permease subunit [Xanthobacteraceae bacterium Astr-EGSB]|uniref:DHA2 family efflux MFS transporter permease subunit n=1 Tax=Astrobacterium formosum TaxID=3069710 RepID=UPI0027AE6ADC|nr:DHA2 family efflux MFS transporter permease subunit [Xanthobacteraceae bacterium Astr-EGSB]
MTTPHPLQGPRRMALTVCAMSATIMQALDTTIANVALPYMQGSLSASLDQVNWVLTSYIVAAAIMTAPIGWMAGRFGRKRLFIVCVAGFTGASFLCALAQNIEQMVLFRMMQGSFGAALVPLSQSVMLDAYTLEERGQAMAIWGMGVMLGPIMGPTLGGWLTETYTWHWVFLINLPIGIVTVAGLLAFMDETDTESERRFDWFGFLSLAVGIASLQLMLDRGEQLGWFDSAEIVTELVISIAGFYFFFAHTLTTDNPFVRFELFRDRNFAGGCLFMAFIGIALFGTMALVSPFMQNILGYPVIDAGVLLGTRGIGTLITMIVVGRLLQYVEARWLIGLGIVLLAVTLDQMVGFTDQTQARTIAIVSIVQGVGLGLVFVPLSTVAFMSLPAHLRTDGTSMLTLVRNIFSSIGISVMIAELSRTTTAVHSQLVEHVTPFAAALAMPDVASVIDMTTQAGQALLDSIVTKQAAVIAYSNDFKMLMLLSLVALPLILVVGSSRTGRRGGGGKAGHVEAME